VVAGHGRREPGAVNDMTIGTVGILLDLGAINIRGDGVTPDGARRESPCR